MGNKRRMAMKYAAAEVRGEGEVVILLIPPAATASTATPLDVVSANTPQKPENATQVTIYAKVTYSDAKIDYEEGGRTILRKATIEATAQERSNMDACYAVQLQNGWILLKKGAKINESRSLYYLDVEGYVKVQE